VLGVSILFLVWHTWQVAPSASLADAPALEPTPPSILPGLALASLGGPTLGTSALRAGGACPTGSKPEGCGGQRCCWQLQNQRVRAALTDDPHLQWHAFEEVGAVGRPAALPVTGRPLFRLFSKKKLALFKQKALHPSECKLQNATQASARALLLLLVCGLGVTVEFSAQLPTETAHYLRFSFRIWSRVGGKSTSSPFQALTLFDLKEPLRVYKPGNADTRYQLDPIDGLPLVVNRRFFVGVEHPMASIAPIGEKSSNQTHWAGAFGQITHLGNLQRPSLQDPWEYGAVFGVFSEMSQSRRAFVAYLHAERPGRRTPMVHYNSWYDFYSYQDEGYNGGFTDFRKNPELIAGLRKDMMDEDSCTGRVEAFGEELVVKRNTKIDSFLWDDGWDNPETLWEFDKKRFPRGFDPVAAKARSYNSGTGVWLSPWGGYGFTQEARIKYGKKHGYETNSNERTEREGFSLAGPKYRKAFHDVALMMVREQAVNMFKFDGVAGDPQELALEMEAMLRLITDLRVASRQHTDAVGGNKSKKEGKSDKDLWINLTTGTWPSPFFLLWADTIWRGGPDIASRPQDWEPDGARRKKGKIRDGLSRRQRWIRWRNLIIYVLVVTRSHFFPISQLMIHGVVLASHGDALHWGLDTFDAIDFEQEVWSFVALGLQLQELYVAPRHMTAQAWDMLAEGLQWSRREAAVLRDSHWSFGDPTEREVYCVASWDVETARGFLFIHNPIGVSQLSMLFLMAEVLELPVAEAATALSVRIVKSISRPEGPTESNKGHERFIGWGCTPKPLVNSTVAGVDDCIVRGDSSIRVQTLPTEVLVLAVERATAAPGGGRQLHA